jgi:CRP-like cAMP-binding protein
MNNILAPKKNPLMIDSNKLNKIGIFNSMSDDELDETSKNGLFSIYKKGQTLFIQGNSPYGIFCILKGNIKLTKIGPDGKESIIRIATVGDILGHRSLFANSNYSTTATAISDTEVYFFEKKYIMALIDSNLQIAKNIITKLSLDMGCTESKLTSLQQKNVRERVAELLLNLKNTHGIQEGNSIKINIKLTREEMAEMIGTANETLVRILTEFKEADLIEQNSKMIYIKNESELINWARIRY